MDKGVKVCVESIMCERLRSGLFLVRRNVVLILRKLEEKSMCVVYASYKFSLRMKERREWN